MINVSITWLRPDPDDPKLFETPTPVGFWTWHDFVTTINRWYRWGIKFRVESISGYDHYSKHPLQKNLIKVSDPGADGIIKLNYPEYRTIDLTARSDEVYIARLIARINSRTVHNV